MKLSQVLSEEKQPIHEFVTSHLEDFKKWFDEHGHGELEVFAHERAEERYDGIDPDDEDRGSDASSDVAGMVDEEAFVLWLKTHGYQRAEVEAWGKSPEYDKWQEEWWNHELYHEISDFGYEVCEDYGYSGK